MVVSDITSKNTLEDAAKWRDVALETCDQVENQPIPCVVVQNKSDLITGDPETYQSQQYLDNFASSNGFEKGFQISAKINKAVDSAFEALIRQAIQFELAKAKAVERGNNQPKNFESIHDSVKNNPTSSQPIILGKSKAVEDKWKYSCCS